MRGVFYLELDDFERAAEDVKVRSRTMLRALVHKDSVRVPGAYYEVGAISTETLVEYLRLLGLIAGREFSFGGDLDEAAKKQQSETWQQCGKGRKHKKLDLGSLKSEARHNEKPSGNRRCRCGKRASGQEGDTTCVTGSKCAEGG